MYWPWVLHVKVISVQDVLSRGAAARGLVRGRLRTRKGRLMLDIVVFTVGLWPCEHHGFSFGYDLTWSRS